MNNLQLTLTSQEVSKMVEKRHDHLIRDIATYEKYLQDTLNPKIGVNDFFIQSTYKDNIGRKLKCYNITKKGCELIAHKMTGQKGVLFTAEYINRFHEMEEQLKIPKAEYLFQPKTYKGQPCVTLADLAHFAGITQHTIRYHIKKVLKNGSDYIVLNGSELVDFKAENIAVDLRLASSLTIVFKSGFVKLTRLIKGLPKQLECFKAQLPPKRQYTPPRVSNMPDIVEAQRLVKEIRENLAGINSTLKLFMRYNQPENQDSFAKTIEHFGMLIMMNCGNLSKQKYSLIERPY